MKKLFAIVATIMYTLVVAAYCSTPIVVSANENMANMGMKSMDCMGISSQSTSSSGEAALEHMSCNQYQMAIETEDSYEYHVPEIIHIPAYSKKIKETKTITQKLVPYSNSPPNTAYTSIKKTVLLRV